MIIQCSAKTNNRRFREMTKKYISVYDCGISVPMYWYSFIRGETHKFVMLFIYMHNIYCNEIPKSLVILNYYRKYYAISMKKALRLI